MAKNEGFFPIIGEIAERTDKLQEETYNTIHEDRQVQEIESLCMHCEKNGTTRLLLTSIPYFREVILMSFRCEHCGWENNEVQSAGIIRGHGTLHTARILTRRDLNRQLVKSSTCTIVIPEYEFTIPSSRGQLTTVEGILQDAVTDLGADQPLRRIQAPEAYEKIQSIIDAFRDIIGDEDENEGNRGGECKERVKQKDLPKSASLLHSFTMILDDPAGNSFIEFIGSMGDLQWSMKSYDRTREQDAQLGLSMADEKHPAEQNTGAADEQTKEARMDESSNVIGGGLKGKNEELYNFPGVCSSCGAPLDTIMKKVNIPHFKDILIMATNCERCGYRDNEVKSGSAISEKGRRITLKVEDKEDLSRDLLKSETCGLQIPEISLTLQAGTLGGRFTTLEGILEQVYQELSEKVIVGDSATDDRKAMENFLENLKSVKAAERPFTVILEDPLANSFLQNPYAPDPDPNMTIESFERSWEQNEVLGLNDIKVEGYEEDAKTIQE